MRRSVAICLPLALSAATHVLLSTPCLHTPSESGVATSKVGPSPGDAAMLQLQTGCEFQTLPEISPSVLKSTGAGRATGRGPSSPVFAIRH